MNDNSNNSLLDEEREKMQNLKNRQKVKDVANNFSKQSGNKKNNLDFNNSDGYGVFQNFQFFISKYANILMLSVVYFSVGSSLLYICNNINLRQIIKGFSILILMYFLMDSLRKKKL